MQIRFLLGPAGSGKTHRCLSEAREELLRGAGGEWLIFLAPRQATFQLERQLLSTPELKACSRLRILSFERLARFVLDELDAPFPSLLSQEGRVMVLRAILAERASELKVFHKSARRPGFAQELSGQLREFHQFGITPATLRKLAAENGSGRLPNKLADFAVVFEAYNAWLRDHHLLDPDTLLTHAAEALQSRGSPAPLKIGKLWLDGFAQMTPQERALLRAVLACGSEATLAFCTGQSESMELPWDSSWNVVHESYRHCRNDLEGSGVISVERLGLPGNSGRFSSSPLLGHIEHFWNEPRDYAVASPQDLESCQIWRCANAEQEAIACAREIWRLVRGGMRFRDIAILLRNLDTHAEVISRVFHRYEIPIFLDRRESVAHHPLAELARGALRVVGFNWRINDLFAVLKSGLTSFKPDEIDVLENAVLENGWEGAAWDREFILPRQDDESEKREKYLATVAGDLNKSRLRVKELLAPFEEDLGRTPTAGQIKHALDSLGRRLALEDKLAEWTRKSNEQLHQQVLEQMEGLLANLQLAFGDRAMDLREWLPIIEAGLSALTVGLIPPALDQVLVGAVDRSRNPDLKAVFIPGFNDGIFPARPQQPILLTEIERTALENLDCRLSFTTLRQLSAEQFYAYIACTRARERLIITFSQFDPDGKPLTPSRFITHLQRLCGTIQIREVMALRDGLASVEHLSEVVPLCLANPADDTLWGLLGTRDSLREQLQALTRPIKTDPLSKESVELLYGKDELCTSVSRLEEYANCPFKFFVSAGLRAQERKRFEFDLRGEGDFQHQVMAEFHNRVRKQNRQWRDLTPGEAGDLIGQIADDLLPTFKNGLLTDNDQNKFRAAAYKKALQEFIRVMIEWARSSYHFEPHFAELSFDGDSEVEHWTLELGKNRLLRLRGRVDRIDLYRTSKTSGALVVLDYKSSKKELQEKELHNGFQQQLPAYLLALTKSDKLRTLLGLTDLVPAGCFFVNLRGKFDSASNREEATLNPELAHRKAYQHKGLLDQAHLHLLDSEKGSGQFVSWTQKGEPRKSFSAQSSKDFAAWLGRVESSLKNYATEILEGRIEVKPTKRNSKLTCEYCEYLGICRFDPWQHTPRTLQPLPVKQKAQ